MAAPDPKHELVEVVRGELVKDLDLARYNVRAVAAEVMALANLPGDALRTGWYTAVAGFVGFVLTALLFVTRMPGIGVFFFSVVGGLLALLCGVVLGASFVGRRKMQACIKASDEVLDVVGDMHRDLVELRNGKAHLTVRATAATLSRDVVFPMISESGIGAAETFLRGPLKALARPVVGKPLEVVEKSVTAAIANLPIAALDAAMSIDADDPMSGTKLQTAMREVDQRYDAIKLTVADHVRSLMAKSLVPVVITAFVAAMPLVCWWLLGFWLT